MIVIKFLNLLVVDRHLNAEFFPKATEKLENS